MIRKTSTHLLMGLRPTGLYESVNLSDLSVSFSREEPLGEPFAQPFTLPESTLISIEALRILRSLRPTMLLKPKTVKISCKEKSSDPKPSQPKRAKRKSASATELTSRLAGLDPVTAELIRRLGGL